MAGDRFTVVRQAHGWRVKDGKDGTLHTTIIPDKARVQRIADRMNARFDSRKDG